MKWQSKVLTSVSIVTLNWILLLDIFSGSMFPLPLPFFPNGKMGGSFLVLLPEAAAPLERGPEEEPEELPHAAAERA